MLSGAEMVVRALQDEGVEYIFGYPGGAVLHIYDALFQQDKVNHILVRHEQAATHAADGYARSTGKPGVVLVTSGPGATNAITGIATAFMDSIPMVVLSGQVRSDWIGDDAFQETDMIGLSRPIVKHSFMVRDPSEIPEMVKKAFYIASTGRPGPVLIDIPKDHTAPNKTFPYEYPKKVKMRSYMPVSRGHSGQIRKAVDELLKAKRPVIYSGGGVVQGDASEALTAVARKLNYPVTNTLMGLGAYPGTDKQFLGMLGMHGTYEANMSMHNADVILAAGARLDDRVTNDAKKFCPGAKIIHIDIDPASISKNVTAHIPIVGPVKQVLEEMLTMIDEHDSGPDHKSVERWWQEIDGWRQVHGLRYEVNENGPMKPQQVVQALYKATNGEAFVTSDVGQHQMFAAQYYLYDRPRQWINSGGLGTMGFGLPAAMGVQFAYPDGLRHRRRLDPDEHSGALHLSAVRSADQDHQHQQPGPGHGAPVAGHAVRRPSQPVVHGIPAGLRQAGGILRARGHVGGKVRRPAAGHGRSLRAQGPPGIHGYLRGLHGARLPHAYR